MEDKIFARQTAKRQLASGVADDEQLLRQFNDNEMQKLYSLDDGYPMEEDQVDSDMEAELSEMVEDVKTGRGRDRIKAVAAASAAADAAGKVLSPGK
eukprot:365518-Prorocentrum_lima.AAC.1